MARIRRQSERLLAAHTGRPVEQLCTDTDRALVLTGEAAIAYGVADHLVGSEGSGGEHAEVAAPLRPDV